MDAPNLISDAKPCKVNARREPFTQREDYFIAAFGEVVGFHHLATFDLPNRTVAALKKRAWWLRTHRHDWWNQVQSDMDADLP